MGQPAKVRSSKFSAGLVATALLICVACSPPVVKQYEKDGVQFSYYSNWTIAKDAPIAGKPDVRSIQIEGPSHAIISLICAPPSNAQTLEQFADAVATRRGAAIKSKLSAGGVLPAEVSKGNSNPTTGKVAGKDRDGLLQEFNIDFLGQQIPHQVKFYLVQGTKYKVMIMHQVASKNANETQAGSDLILSTLAIEGAQ